MLTQRIIVDIILLILVVTVPWWFTALCLLAAIFYFKRFYEAFFFALMLDVWFGSGVIFPMIPYFITTVTLFLFVMIRIFKKRLIMY